MKKKMFLASAVCSLSLLFSTVAYAYGSWTNETQTFPAYMGVIHSSSQPKHFSDGAA
jgi:hypothetical protein